ncbi:fused MFS/spermidine synthase, partial [Candidatus Desantisbacteria bacterium]|nr:fused MFS/spermidine synthase [Candidatus Desantisbacteria bacterium]
MIIQRLSLSILLIVIGFVSVISQSLLIYELTGVFYDNELCLGIIFAGWLFWMAVGSLVAGKIFKPIGEGFHSFIFSQIIVSILLPLTIIFIKMLRVFLHIPVGELIGYHVMVISIPLLTAPLGIVIGAQFTLGCRLWGREQGSMVRGQGSEVRGQRTGGRIYPIPDPETSLAAGKVYLYDAIGDAFGGFAFGFVFVNFFNSLTTAFYTAIINVFCGIMILFLGIRKIFLVAICVICLSANVYGILNADRLMSYTTSLNWKGFSVVKNAFSKYGNLTVVKTDNLYNFYHNGMLVFTSPEQLENEELIHFPLLQTPQVKQILILGGAVAGGLNEALKYKGAEIYFVELDPALIKTARKYIPKTDIDSLDNSRVKIIHGDGRLFIKRWRGKPFDALIINTGNPSTAERNRFYTLEFFEEAKRILKPDGVISLGCRSNENYLGENMLQFNGCIYHTLQQIFPSIILIPGDELTLIASSKSEYLSNDPHVLAERLKHRGIMTRFVNEPYLSYRFCPERIEYLRESLEGIVSGINHDLHPVCYYFDIALWVEEFSQGSEGLFNLLSGIKSWQLILVFAFVAIIPWFIFRNKRMLIPTGVFISGCGGMVLEIVLIIGFQILFGYIYHLIGITIAGFMLGIAGGTWWMNSRIDKIQNRMGVYSLLQVATALYLFLTPVIFLGLRVVSDEFWVQFVICILFPILTVAAGILVGLIFPLANRIYSDFTKDTNNVGGIMYAMDLGGACVGSFIAAVLAIPVLGIIQTSMVFGVLNLLMGLVLYSILQQKIVDRIG